MAEFFAKIKDNFNHSDGPPGRRPGARPISPTRFPWPLRAAPGEHVARDFCEAGWMGGAFDAGQAIG